MISDMELRFTNHEITPWGGLAVLFKMLEKCGFKDVLENCPLPRQGSNRGYSPIQLIYSLFAGVWCGASNFSQLEIIRYDNCLRRILGWQRGAGSKAYTRYFDKFTQADNQRIFTQLYKWFFDNLQLDNYTLDWRSSKARKSGSSAWIADSIVIR